MEGDVEEELLVVEAELRDVQGNPDRRAKKLDSNEWREMMPVLSSAVVFCRPNQSIAGAPREVAGEATPSQLPLGWTQTIRKCRSQCGAGARGGLVAQFPVGLSGRQCSIRRLWHPFLPSKPKGGNSQFTPY